MLRPGDVDKHSQPMRLSQIEQPGGRDIINSQHIGAELPQLVEICASLSRLGKHVCRRIWRKWTVSDALDVELRVAHSKELAIHPHTGTRLTAAVYHCVC